MFFLVLLMVNHDWKVFFHHIPRMHIVDHMAKIMATRFTEVKVFQDPPYFVQDLVREDYSNISHASVLSY